MFAQGARLQFWKPRPSPAPSAPLTSTPDTAPRWLRKLLYALIAIALALASLRFVWGRHAQRKLDREVAAIRARHEPLDPADFVAAPIPPERDLAILLAPAAAAYVRTDFDSVVHGFGRPDAKFADLFQKHLVANAPLYAALKKIPSNAEGTPPYVRQSNLADILTAGASIHICQGDDATAADKLLLLRHLACYDRFVSVYHRWGVNLSDDLSTLVLRMCAHLPASARVKFPAHRDQLVELLALLSDESSIRKPALRSIARERAAVLQSPLPPAAEMHMPSAFLAQQVNMALAPLAISDRARDLHDLSDEYGWIQAGGAAPAHFAPRVHYLELTDWHLRLVTQRRIATLALAIRLYQLDHGSLPPFAAALVPHYLSELPRDPYSSASQPIGYSGPCADPFVFSVGDDRIDNVARGQIPRNSPDNCSSFAYGTSEPDLIAFLNAPPPTTQPSDP